MEFVLFLMYKSIGIYAPIKYLILKPPIPTFWQTQNRDETRQLFEIIIVALEFL